MWGKSCPRAKHKLGSLPSAQRPPLPRRRLIPALIPLSIPLPSTDHDGADDDNHDEHASNMMQRRSGSKSQAHIAPPTPNLVPMEPFASEKSPSRLNQRSFGVTNRIWLILSLFLAILLFTRFALPSSSTDSYYSRSLSQAYTSKLKPTNYLNVSAEVGPYPFEFCPTFGPGDELAERYGALAISKSWLHLGSGARVQKVVHRALLGQPVTISVIGGSGQFIYFFFVLFVFSAFGPQRSLCQKRRISGRGHYRLP